MGCSSAAATRRLASQSNSQLHEIAEVRSTALPVARPIQIAAAGSQGFAIVAHMILSEKSATFRDHALAV
jgi:hypothetical protein